MQQNDDEIIYTSLLTREDYDRIESLVDLYIELNIRIFQIDLIEIAKQKGYRLIPYSKLDSTESKRLREKELSGLTLKNQNGLPIIFYDDNEVWYRQHFTIMHEIGHIVLGHQQESRLANQCANFFASYSLSPSPIVKVMECEDFMDVADRFGLSPDSASLTFSRFEKWLKVPVYKEHELKLLRHFGITI